jgi:aminomethyltransferase
MGDPVYAGGKKVGVVTCAMVSTLTKKSMAIVRLDLPQAVHGTKLELRGKNVKPRRPRIRCPSTIPRRKSARRG